MLCNTCKLDLSDEHFTKSARHKCKSCKAIYAKTWRETNLEYDRERQKKYHHAHKEKKQKAK